MKINFEIFNSLLEHADAQGNLLITFSFVEGVISLGKSLVHIDHTLGPDNIIVVTERFFFQVDEALYYYFESFD